MLNKAVFILKYFQGCALLFLFQLSPDKKDEHESELVL